MFWQATIHFPPHCDGLISQPGIRAALYCLLLINFGVFPSLPQICSCAQEHTCI